MACCLPPQSPLRPQTCGPGWSTRPVDSAVSSVLMSHFGSSWIHHTPRAPRQLGEAGSRQTPRTPNARFRRRVPCSSSRAVPSRAWLSMPPTSITPRRPSSPASATTPRRDLLRALRRGARAWTPLEPLLHERAPTGLDLDDDLLAELLSDGATLLQGTGFEVLWPLGDPRRRHRAAGRRRARSGCRGRGRFRSGHPGRVPLAGHATWRTALRRGDRPARRGQAGARPSAWPLGRRRSGPARAPAGAPAASGWRRPRRSARCSRGTVDLDGEPVPVVAEGPVAELAGRLARVDRHADPARRAAGSGPRRRAPALPAPGRRLAARHDRGRARRLPGRRHGPRQDPPGHRPPPPPRRRRPAARPLVVCPTSLLGNWEREVRRFAPATVGPPPPRPELAASRSWPPASSSSPATASPGGMPRCWLDGRLRPGGRRRGPARQEPARRRPHGRCAPSAAPARLALTGTPVENRLSDLWSILDWTTPGLLGPFERFVRTVAVASRAQPRPGGRPSGSPARSAPSCCGARRRDPGVAPDLPPRTVTDVAVPLTQRADDALRGRGTRGAGRDRERRRASPARASCCAFSPC